MYILKHMIPIYLLETFVLFGENANLVKTAKVLNQTQPTTSRQIELLQSHFKKPLFKTVGRTKQLTEYGHQVQQYYKKSILELRELQNRMTTLPFAAAKERLSIAARSEFLEKYISEINFISSVEFHPASQSEIRQKIQTQSIDVAITQESIETHNYNRKKLFSSDWRIIYPETWKNKITSKSSPEQLIQEASPLPFASYDKDLLFLKNHFIKKSNLPKFNVELVANDWRLLQKAVQNQKFWAIVPSDFAKADKVVSISANSLMYTNNFYIYFLKRLAKNKDIDQLISAFN